ncbi:hypothetical protein RDABS01_024408 [Bienertia sinuspersici]
MQKIANKISKIAAVSQRDKQASSLHSLFLRSFSHSSFRDTFGIAFDIDGVLLRGKSPIGGSPQALNKLYHNSGGGVRESKRAVELSKLLGVGVSPSQVLHGHSPFRHLAHRFENDFVVAVGKGEPAAVLSEYGFKNVISIDDYTLCFDNIDPLAPHKNWAVNRTEQNRTFPSVELKNYVCSQRVSAVFVVSDPVDWSRDIQVLCDILRTGGLPGGEIGSQPLLYFAHDDLKYQAGSPWFSILTRTGVFRGRGNDPEFPADMVRD